MQRSLFPDRSAVLFPLIVGLVVLVGAAAVGGAIGLNLVSAPLVFAVPLAVVAIWVAYRTPGVVFAAYLAIPFYKAGTEAFLPFDLTLALALINSVLAVLILLPRGTNGVDSLLADPRRRRAAMVWLTLTVLIVLGVLYAPDLTAARERALVWLATVVLPFVVAFRIVAHPRYLRQFLWTLFGIGVAVTINGMWLLPEVGEWPADRLVVFGAHTIRVGQAALLVLLIGFSYIIPTSKPIVRLAALALVPPALLVAASSGSRGPLLFGAITLVLLTLRTLAIRIGSRQHPRQAAPLRIAAVVLLVGLLVGVLQPSTLLALFPATAVERLGTISDIFLGLTDQSLAETAPDTSTAERLIAYDGAIAMFNRNPLVGGGTASFESFTQIAGLTEWTGEFAYPHNIILQFAAEYGLAGLGVFLLLLVTAFRNLLARSRDPLWNACLVLLVFFLLGALVSNGIVDNRMVWGLVLIGIAAGAENGQVERARAERGTNFANVSRPAPPRPTSDSPNPRLPVG